MSYHAMATSIKSRDDIVIAVMGAVGSGKSTLISKLVDSRVPVGNGSHACTTDIEMYDSFLSSDRRIRLLDTPGFDNTHISDVQILYKISEYLSKIYQPGFQLSGIVYLHRISESRLNGFIGNNLALFKSLCGDTFYPRVVLATTNWNSLTSAETGARREAEILRGEWGLMCQRGSKVFRLENSGQSALSIVEYLIDLQAKDRHSVQQELVEEQEVQILRQINQELSDNIGDTMDRYEKEFTALKIDMEEAARSKDIERARTLGAQQDRLRMRLENSQRSRHALFANLERLRLETEERHNRLLREISPVAESVSTPSTGSQARAQRVIDREKVEKLLSELERRGPPFPDQKKQTSVILHRRGTGIREEFSPKIKRTDSALTQQTTTDSVRLGKRQDVTTQDKKAPSSEVQRPSSSPGLQSQPFSPSPYEQSVSSEAVSTSSGLQSATPKSSRDYLHYLSPDNRAYWSRILNPEPKAEAFDNVITPKESKPLDYRARVSDTEDDYKAVGHPNLMNEPYAAGTLRADVTSIPEKEPKPQASRALSPESQSDSSILSYMNPDRRAYWSRVLGPDPEPDYGSTKDSISELALSPTFDRRAEPPSYPIQQPDQHEVDKFSPNRYLSKSSSPIRRLTYQDELMSLSSSRPSFDRYTPTPSIKLHEYSQGFQDVDYRSRQQVVDRFQSGSMIDEDHGLDWSKLSLTETDRGQGTGPTWNSEAGSQRGRTYERQSTSKEKERDYFGISRWDEPLGY